jgi:hypothetical protein
MDAEFSVIETHVSRGFRGTRDNPTHYPVDVTGCGRNSPINRKDVREQVSRNATSAIWNAT